MNFKLTLEQLAWRDEVREFLRNELTQELRDELTELGMFREGPLIKSLYDKIAAMGWTSINWPKEYGGLEKSAIDQFIYMEEFMYAGVPLLAPPIMIAPAIIKHGTEENKKKWLPLLRKGEFFSLGYSEPDAGTDLASLATRAELIGGEWVINGIKLWNTCADRSTHMWALVRTDPAAPTKHKGISIIVIPFDAPGMSMRPIETWGEETTFEVVIDNVHVPKENLIGEVNKGWAYVNSALDSERMMTGCTGELRRIFDELVSFCKLTVIDGEVLAKKPAVRMRIAELAMDLEVAVLFGWRGASNADAGGLSQAHASMMKVFVSELSAKLADWGTQVMALYGQLNRSDPEAPMSGEMEHLYRNTPFRRFAAGANEVQRGIIAQGLGMPRR